MSVEAISYLKPEDQEAIKSWTEELGPIVESTPLLKGIDLIVEGGVGTGTTMPDIARLLFPKAIYVGTELLSRDPRLIGAVNKTDIDEIRRANDNPADGLWNATIHANCFDNDLISDLKVKLGRKSAALVSFNALYALSGKDLSHFDKKIDSDRRTVEQIVSLDGPYDAQIHIGVYWEDNGETSRSSSYFRLDSAAQQAGWNTQRFDIGLLLTHPQSSDR